MLAFAQMVFCFVGALVCVYGLKICPPTPGMTPKIYVQAIVPLGNFFALSPPGIDGGYSVVVQATRPPILTIRRCHLSLPGHCRHLLCALPLRHVDPV